MTEQEIRGYLATVGRPGKRSLLTEVLRLRAERSIHPVYKKFYETLHTGVLTSHSDAPAPVPEGCPVDLSMLHNVHVAELIIDFCGWSGTSQGGSFWGDAHKIFKDFVRHDVAQLQARTGGIPGSLLWHVHTFLASRNIPHEVDTSVLRMYEIAKDRVTPKKRSETRETGGDWVSKLVMYSNKSLPPIAPVVKDVIPDHILNEVGNQ